MFDLLIELMRVYPWQAAGTALLVLAAVFALLVGLLAITRPVKPRANLRLTPDELAARRAGLVRRA